jgi:hypothetical protein
MLVKGKVCISYRAKENAMITGWVRLNLKMGDPKSPPSESFYQLV